ncbi:TetR/AcrR family transcriptional regulator [Martelella sp. HB161492]|uniref:TetR/AcrR family transcriptional regulator n=1 Tax=Martelella sp. HB161492 TaxID=2720726 RepID=UPI0015925C40|nr:TetR/AcrR family transcriptional regulator [Martelella sp. HB161492]
MTEQDEAESASRRNETRDIILNVAKELVARKGPKSTTVRDITNASGANTAAVNYYFQSKDALVRLATQEITGDVNRERLARLNDMEMKSADKVLQPRQILEALIEPILTMSRSVDGGSLYVRNVFQMRVDARAGYDNFNINSHAARRFIQAMQRTFPTLSLAEIVWNYEFARGASVHMLANLDPVSRRFEHLMIEPNEDLPAEPCFRLDEAAVQKVIDMILAGFCKSV